MNNKNPENTTPRPPPPPLTEVQQRIQYYQKTKIVAKTPPPASAPPPVETQSIPKPVVERKEPENYTHILTILIQHNDAKIAPSIIAETNRRILKECARILHNTTHTKMLANNVYVPLLWSQQGSIYSNKYYANVELFGDVAVKKHTVLLLDDVVQQIDDLFDFAFSKKNVELIFDVTKPLTKKITLL